MKVTIETTDYCEIAKDGKKIYREREETGSVCRTDAAIGEVGNDAKRNIIDVVQTRNLFDINSGLDGK